MELQGVTYLVGVTDLSGVDWLVALMDAELMFFNGIFCLILIVTWCDRLFEFVSLCDPLERYFV